MIKAVIIEDDAAAYLQFANPSTSEAGFLSGTDLANIRGGLIFRPDSSLHLRSGGNNTRVAILANGNTGIGTTAPSAKLEVNGTTVLGANGTSLNEIIKITVVKNVPSIPLNSSSVVDFSVTNAATSSTVYISPEQDLPDGIIIAYARVHSTGIVKVKFTNVTGAAIDPPSMNYYITVIR